ncbi:hypothetical protein [Acidiferrobacter sp.]|uniref:hypothetical protein n=1 Tax=Acidiferrobacter sp. TaxID=1872107 RepID=UPI00262578A7|nr:hypothetical protein [Acidiferrobacter sp.]
MSLADRFIVEVTAAQAKADPDRDKRRQLEEVERALETLKSIGVSLEPKFEICLSGRVATVVNK